MSARRTAGCTVIVLAAAAVLARGAVAQDDGGLDATADGLDATVEDGADPDAAAVVSDAPTSLDAPDSAIEDAPAPPDRPPSPDATPSPDGEGYCCPTRASCDCWWRGGFSATGSECGRWGFCIYDADPAGARRSFDAHGCEVLEPGLLSCNLPLDASWRPDAGPPAPAAANCGCRTGALVRSCPSGIALTLAALGWRRRSRARPIRRR